MSGDRQDASGVLSKEKTSPPGKGLEKGAKTVQNPAKSSKTPVMIKKLDFFIER